MSNAPTSSFIVYELVIVYAHLDSAGAVRTHTASVYLGVLQYELVGGDEKTKE
jgi:hypothetical protein